MRCHYEVLGVGQDADDSEIKKSYRKLALKNHPDKHPDAIEEYTKLFREVQAAYDVLSDKQERAWYDKHRDAILRGGEDYVDDSVDIMQYFNPGVYCGYSDGPDGFYTIFRDVFRRIAEEEEAFLEGDSEDEYNVPEFGDSESDYQNIVNRFYSHWLGYCTKKSYSWKDMYDLRQAPNRPTQRLMEKENKKIRDGLKRKRNEEVRALVQYVRKRDRRVQEYVKNIETSKAENKRRADEKRAEEKRLRNEAMENYKEQDWMTVDDRHLDDIDSHFDDQFGSKSYDNIDFSCENDDDDDDEVEMVEGFYCIACDKSFKSEKALSNHEKSKKHKENLELIKSEMDDELLQQLSLDEESRKSSSSRGHSTPSSTADDDEEDSSSNIVDGVSEISTTDPIQRIDSMYLPANVILRNVIDRTEKPKGSNPDLSKTTDCPDHIKTRQKKKSKKKKKSNNYDYVEDEDQTQHWNELHEAKLGAHATDSLALPRRKSKKKELRENVERLRSEEETNLAKLGSSPLADSMKIHKKKSSRNDKRRQRLKLSAINSEEELSIEKDEEEDATFTLGEASSKPYTNNSSEKECDRASSATDGGITPVPLVLIVSDSVPYNMEKMENHSRNHIHDKKKQQSDCNSENNDDGSGDVGSGRNGSAEEVPFVCRIRDSVCYNKEKMEHHCKSNAHPNSHHHHNVCKNQKKYKELIDSDAIIDDDDELENSDEDNETLKKSTGAGISEKINLDNITTDTNSKGKANRKKTDTKSTTEKTSDDVDQNPIEQEWPCGVCGFEFPSRNKLFAHIKAEGHAQLKQQQQAAKKKPNKKSGKKK